MFDALKDGDKLTTINGKELQVQVQGTAVSIDGISILPCEAKISNGVMHLADTAIQ